MLIHIYSTGYMAHEGGYYRFFGYLNLFMFSMLTLILANNYVLMFVGWEGVGLCSYLLIGFYFHRKSASDAANKAFIVNRIGDAGFMLGMFFIAWYMGSLRFIDVTAAARSGHFQIGDPIITAATLLLFVGACGKSAQLPLYVWLPDAMEGPTPVSALIHAATMVTAGVYMVARSNALFVLAPKSMMVVAIVGALTAIFAASIGLVQNDIKRVLAYSTVSQLGYMFLALGVGAFSAGVFHVFTHAFFKALLFLGAGSVIHAMSGEQDMRNMGALSEKIPVTFLHHVRRDAGDRGNSCRSRDFSRKMKFCGRRGSRRRRVSLLWVIGFRHCADDGFLHVPPDLPDVLEPVARDEPRSRTPHPRVAEVDDHAAGDSGVLLAFAGFLGWPHSLGGSDRFEHFLDPVFAHAKPRFVEEGKAGQLAAGEKEEEHTSPTEYLLMFLSVAAAGAGWFWPHAPTATPTRATPSPSRLRLAPVYDTLLNKYYVDEGYDYVFTGRRKVGDVRLGVLGLGEASSWFDSPRDRWRGQRARAGSLAATATFSSWWDKWIIDGIGVNGPAILARMLSYPARLFEWGLVQWYALVMTAGLVGFRVLLRVSLKAGF